MTADELEECLNYAVSQSNFENWLDSRDIPHTEFSLFIMNILDRIADSELEDPKHETAAHLMLRLASTAFSLGFITGWEANAKKVSST